MSARLYARCWPTEGSITPADEAAICADVLIASDLRGIESHGVGRLKYYYDRIKAGVQSTTTHWEIVHETETTALVDGHHGMGHVIAHRAMRMAIEKARRYGLGAVAVFVAAAALGLTFLPQLLASRVHLRLPNSFLAAIALFVLLAGALQLVIGRGFAFNLFQHSPAHAKPAVQDHAGPYAAKNHHKCAERNYERCKRCSKHVYTSPGTCLKFNISVKIKPYPVQSFRQKRLCCNLRSVILRSRGDEESLFFIWTDCLCYTRDPSLRSG